MDNKQLCVQTLQMLDSKLTELQKEKAQLLTKVEQEKNLLVAYSNGLEKERDDLVQHSQRLQKKNNKLRLKNQHLKRQMKIYKKQKPVDRNAKTKRYEIDSSLPPSSHGPLWTQSMLRPPAVWSDKPDGPC